MGKIALLFSGQGAQYPGMGVELCENFPTAREIYKHSADVLGFDVLKLSKEGSAEELAQTIVSQPLIYTLSMAAHAVFTGEGGSAGTVAGFSLGECSALTAAGAMTLQTGLTVIRERAHAMQQAAERSSGAMFAVIGSTGQQLEHACREAGGYVTPVNYNCPGQTVIAGEEPAACAAAKALEAEGLRVVRLPVNAAFHSRMMEDAAETFYEKIGAYPFSVPAFPFYSNITGDTYTVNDVPQYLKTQMTSPVQFASEMEAMKRDGFDTFVELGPGKTLCGFIRRGVRGARMLNVEDKASLSKCLAALGL